MRTKDVLIRTQRVAFQTLANGFKSNRISHAYLIELDNYEDDYDLSVTYTSHPIIGFIPFFLHAR